jgi:TrmH family RNA methyltransferase
VVVVEGPRLLTEAVEAGWVVEALFLAAGAVFETPPGADVFELQEGVLERVGDVDTPQGCIAIVRRALGEVPPEATFVVVCAGVSDPGNLGTIVRSAEAAGADAVVVTPGSADAFSPKTIRASAGAVFRIPVVESDAPELGLRLIGAVAHGGTDHDAVDFVRPFALVFGNEAKGITPELRLDETVTIRNVGRGESLNVAMAATVLCFEVARQRRS